VVGEGDKLGAIVPDGRVQIVAQFPPTSLGRIAPGQRAAMRLDGFSWSQYGAVQAVVSRVAREVRDGSVRVELALDRAPSRIPIGHGLPGSLEIEIERATPASLVLRHAGRLLQ
jgi:multidrug resistance efflux pump